MRNIKSYDCMLLLFFLINSSFLLIGTKSFCNLNNIEIMITYFLGTIVGLSFVNYFKFLLNKNKTINNIILYISSITCFIITIITSKILTNFIHYNLLEDINPIFITITFLSLVIFINKKKTDTIIKVCGIFIYFFLLITLIEYISLLKYINIYQINLNFNINLINIFKSLNIFIIITISPYFYLFFINNIKYKNELNKTYILISIYIIINILLTVNILDSNLINTYKYPEIILLKKISLFNNINRLENIFSINIIFSLFIYISMNYNIFLQIFKIKKENKFHLICFLILLLSNFFI